MKQLKIDALEYNFKRHYISAIYFKNKKWRIYEASSYDIRTVKSANELIKEVCEEMSVRKKNVKLVRCTSLLVKEVSFK